MPPRLQVPGGLDTFLREAWQSRPLLMRQALPGFRSPLSADELAGLACEPSVESRLVLEQGARPWEVRHGPFDDADFAALPESHWTLLVQDVDKHVPAVADLLDAFGFIPDWRFDDIMVSYAADQGSVGPHLDEYDVFLIQAEGRRRWQIAPPPAGEPDLVPGLDLAILERFQGSEQWVLEPGDLLYLPPGVPHWGIAEGPCMTWSVGLRAPDWRELATGWCDEAIARRLPRARYGDPGLRAQRHRGEITADLRSSLRERIETALGGADEATFAAWLGSYLTEPKENLEPRPPEAPISPADLRRTLTEAGQLTRTASRILFTRLGDGRTLLFAAGGTQEIAPALHELAVLLADNRELSAGRLAAWLDDPAGLELLTALYNQGHYELRS